MTQKINAKKGNDTVNQATFENGNTILYLGPSPSTNGIYSEPPLFIS